MQEDKGNQKMMEVMKMNMKKGLHLTKNRLPIAIINKMLNQNGKCKVNSSEPSFKIIKMEVKGLLLQIQLLMIG